jgi:hypothetical protein
MVWRASLFPIQSRSTEAQSLDGPMDDMEQPSTAPDLTQLSERVVGGMSNPSNKRQSIDDESTSRLSSSPTSSQASSTRRFVNRNESGDEHDHEEDDEEDRNIHPSLRRRQQVNIVPRRIFATPDTQGSTSTSARRRPAPQGKANEKERKILRGGIPENRQPIKKRSRICTATNQRSENVH